MLKGKRPILLTAKNPSLGIFEQVAASPVGPGDILLKTLNGVRQNGKHELLFRKKVVTSLISSGILI
jgi:hypothetical protein